MNRRYLRLYHMLPPFARELCVNWHGSRLMRLRYGEVFQAEISSFARREWWSRGQWADWQTTTLAQLLQRATQKVPYYRNLHEADKFPVEVVSDPSVISRLPMLDKELVRAAPHRFLADGCSAESMYEEHTSGTTGTPMRLWWSNHCVQSWYACFERRVRNWAGVALGERWALLGGQHIVPPNRRTPPYWVWNEPYKQLYMSCYFLNSRTASEYIDEILRQRITYIYGYPSAVDVLAQYVLESGRNDVRLKAVISNAEQLFASQRARIGCAFQCVVRDTYAPSEIAVAAFECEFGNLHLSPDIGITEVVRPDGTLADFEETGELVVTGLLNADHILIRYRQGDRGALAPPDEACKCGRCMPILRRIEGRMDDVLVTPDGRMIGRLDGVFKAELRVKEAQIIQSSRNSLRVNVVPADGFGAADREEIRKGLVDRMGNVNIEFALLERIPRTAAGKFRAVINEIV